MVAIGATPQGVAWEAQGCFAQGSSHAALPHTAEANPRTLNPAPWPAGGRVPRVRRQVSFATAPRGVSMQCCVSVRRCLSSAAPPARISHGGTFLISICYRHGPARMVAWSGRWRALWRALWRSEPSLRTER